MSTLSAPDPALTTRLLEIVSFSDDMSEISSFPEPTPIDNFPPTETLTTETVSVPEPAETIRLVPTETDPKSTSVRGSRPEVVLVLPITMVLLRRPAVIYRALLTWTLAMVMVLLPEVALMIRLPARSSAVPDGSPTCRVLSPPLSARLMVLTVELAVNGPAPPLISVAPLSVLATCRPLAVCVMAMLLAD